MILNGALFKVEKFRVLKRMIDLGLSAYYTGADLVCLECINLLCLSVN